MKTKKLAYAPLGLAQGGAGLKLRSRDLLKLDQLYLNQGAWNGEQIISESWVQKSRTPHAQIDDVTNYAVVAKVVQGWHAFLCRLLHVGNGGNKIAVFPDFDMLF